MSRGKRVSVLRTSTQRPSHGRGGADAFVAFGSFRQPLPRFLPLHARERKTRSGRQGAVGRQAHPPRHHQGIALDRLVHLGGEPPPTRRRTAALTIRACLSFDEPILQPVGAGELVCLPVTSFTAKIRVPAKRRKNSTPNLESDTDSGRSRAHLRNGYRWWAPASMSRCLACSRRTTPRLPVAFLVQMQSVPCAGRRPIR